VTSPDYLFVTAGVLSVISAVIVTFRGIARGRLLRLPALLWLSLGAGCFLQGFAPNLKVERNAFVMPVSTVAGNATNPRLLVERERQMKALGAVFLVLAAAGLLWQYRGLLFGAPAKVVAFPDTGDNAS
jgi:hypothetical protein